MTVTLKVEGEMGRGSIDANIEVPENWKPSFEEFCKVRGTLRFLSEKLAQEFEPDPSEN